MSAITINVADTVNTGLNKLVAEVSKQTVLACAEKYGFDADEAFNMLGMLLQKKVRGKKSSDSGSDTESETSS